LAVAVVAVLHLVAAAVAVEQADTALIQVFL
jgi:hypothetical protein